MEDEELNFEVSKLISKYSWCTMEEAKKAFDEFVNKYYYDVEQQHKKHVIDDKDYYVINQTFHIFSSLISEEEDRDMILKTFADKECKNFSKIIKIINEENGISHLELAKKSGENPKGLNKIMQRLQLFGLIYRLDSYAEEKYSNVIYSLTRKGKYVLNILERE